MSGKTSSGQNGKGMTPKRGYNNRAYWDRYDEIFRKTKCPICGEAVESDDVSVFIGESACHRECAESLTNEEKD